MKFLRSKLVPKFRSGYLLIGILAGLLVGGGWFAWGAIQSQVGINIYDPTGGAWWPNCQVMSGIGNADGETTAVAGTSNCRLPDVQTITMAYNGATWDRVRTIAIGDAASTGILAHGNFGFNGATWDRLRSGAGSDAATTGILNIGGLGFNGATWDRLVSTTNNADAKPTSGQGNLNVVTTPYTFNGTTFDRIRGANDQTSIIAGTGLQANLSVVREANGVYRSLRGVTAGALSATTTDGNITVVPISTWSCTNTPAVATQATCSKASGGGTVRHVATGITVCISTGATAQTPIIANLRDGASGAGTIIRSWTFAAPINGFGCQSQQDMAMIGTAATAMTIEFAGAGVANSQETVTLTGFSVP